MKTLFIRTLCAVCLVLLCLSLLACNKTDTAPSVDMKKVAEANSSAAVLEKYENYHVRWNVSKDGMPVKSLITKDYIYSDTDEVQQLYSRDGRTYEKSLGRYVATVRFPEEVEAFINSNYFKAPVINGGAADEEILSVTQTDKYQITVTTRLSAERSGEVVRSFNDDGSYSYVKAVYLMSAETLLINDLAYYCVRENGTQRELANARIAYNVKGMWDAESMYDHISDKSYEVRTVTIILDPDTIDERSVTVIARKGDPIALRLGDKYKTVYSNRECTIPYKGDGTYSQDETLYCKGVVINDKIIQMTDITDFNTTEKILDVFDNYYVKWSAPKSGMGQTLLVSKDYVFYINGSTPELYAGEHTYEKSGEYYVATIRDQAEVDEFLATPYFHTPLIDSSAEAETILVRESNDYYHYVTSKLSPRRSAQILEEFGQTNVYDYVKAKYTVTRATYAIEQLTYYGITKHGEEILIANATVEYNVSGIADAEEMYAHITDTSFEQRTITVILDPDTENERTVGAIARRGDPVALRVGDSYKTLYTDRECTIPYKSDETYITDQTLYCKAEATITSDIDMNEIKAEIDSLEASDFKESALATDYVKISFKDHGDVIVRLRGDIAPITVENFKSLVSQKFYDGLKMHRIIYNFMIQGGDGKLNGAYPPSIKGEFEINGVKNPLSHVPGVISMARTYDYDSASSQFFIVSGPDALHLDGYYAGFGYVVAGLDVITQIHAVETDKNNTPITPVVIEKICFVTEK